MVICFHCIQRGGPFSCLSSIYHILCLSFIYFLSFQLCFVGFLLSQYFKASVLSFLIPKSTRINKCKSCAHISVLDPYAEGCHRIRGRNSEQPWDFWPFLPCMWKTFCRSFIKPGNGEKNRKVISRGLHDTFLWKAEISGYPTDLYLLSYFELQGGEAYAWIKVISLVHF